MIEKFFDKGYPIANTGEITKSTLVRTANRLIREYSLVFGREYIPEEIKAIAEKIKQGEDSEEYEYENASEHCGYGDKVYDSVKYTYEARACAFWDTDEYGDFEYRVTWYFYTSEYYTKRIGKQVLRAGTYADILKKAIAAKGKYRYFCTHRPPAGGVIPAGYVSYDTYSQGQRYIGEVTYNEKPDKDELNNWGLVFDKEWEKIRKVYLEEEDERFSN